MLLDHDTMVAYAAEREELHRFHPTSRPLRPDYELIGLQGDNTAAWLTGGEVNQLHGPQGDKGIDQIVFLRDYGVAALDAKCSANPLNLPVVVKDWKPNTIYVLVRYEPGEALGTPLGWEWSEVVARAAIGTIGSGTVLNYKIPAGQLRKMREFTALLP